MPTRVYTQADADMRDGTINIMSDVLKVMLVQPTYVFDPSHTAVDPSILSHELSVGGYTGGWGGASRLTWVVERALNSAASPPRVDYGMSGNLTWPSLLAGQTIGFAIVIKEGPADDTDSRPIIQWDITDFPTNGNFFTLLMATAASGGNFQDEQVIV